MGEANRTIIIHAYDDSDEPGGIGFGMSGYGVRHDEISFSKDKANHKMGKNDPHKVVFELANRSSVQLRFHDDVDVAMWVAADDQTCPRSACHQKNVCEATHVSKDGEQLTVKNANKQKGRYKFALNFVGPDRKLYSFDPIIANQNGGLEH